MSSSDKLGTIFSKLCELSNLIDNTDRNKYKVNDIIKSVYYIINSSNTNKSSLYLSNGIQSKLQELFRIYFGESAEINRVLSHIKDNMNLSVRAVNLCSCGAEIDALAEECSSCETIDKDLIKVSRSREENVIQHLHGWLDRIQGIEKTNISHDIIDRIAKKIRNEHSVGARIRDVSYLTLYDFREYLGQLGLNKYYKHIVKIRRMVLNEFDLDDDPPLLTEGEKSTITFMFNKCYRAYNKIKNDPELLCKLGIESKSNVMYYPYILYKILPKIITDKRLAALTNNIVMQDSDTIYKDDITWNYMIEKIPDIDDISMQVYDYGSYIF